MRIVKSFSVLGTQIWKRRSMLSVCAAALSLVCVSASPSPASAELAANGAPLSGTGSQPDDLVYDLQLRYWPF